MSKLRVLVGLGTDAHPFTRLVRWADRWAADHPGDDVLVQFGASEAPAVASGTSFYGRPDMLARYAESDVVVLSCGPGAVMDARGTGRRPVVVPRRSDLGEHVDDHQGVFARHLDRHGLAFLVEDEPSFRLALERARREPSAFLVDQVDAEPPGIRRIGELIDALVTGTRTPRTGLTTGRGRSTR